MSLGFINSLSTNYTEPLDTREVYAKLSLQGGTLLEETDKTSSQTIQICPRQHLRQTRPKGKELLKRL